jgi:hypothetical protein
MKRIVAILIVFIVFILTLQMQTDLDLGWHLRYGQYFFQTGHVLRDNIISFVFPDYKWVQASWGYDLLLYQLFVRFGFIGMSVAGAMTSTLIFMILVWPIGKRNVASLIFLAAIFLSQTTPLFAAGFRSQTPSSLLFALLIVLLSRHPIAPSNSFALLPLLFLVWANLHGGFALGLLLMCIMWLVQAALTRQKNTSISMRHLIIFGLFIILSVLATLCNPWGIQIYRETFMHTTNINLSLIGEWTPLTTSPPNILLLVVIVTMVAYTAWRRHDISHLPFLTAFAFATYLGISAIRFETNYGIMATWYLATYGTVSDWIPKSRQRFVILVGSLILVAGIVFDCIFTRQFFVFSLPQVLTSSWATYCRTLGTCSEDVTAAMLRDPPLGNGFHPYNYGGYISWRVPSVKTFLDGRMAAWEDEQGRTPPILDGDRVFEDKQPVMFRKMEATYKFNWIIIPSESLLNEYISQSGLWTKKYGDSKYSYYVKKS